MLRPSLWLRICFVVFIKREIWVFGRGLWLCLRMFALKKVTVIVNVGPLALDPDRNTFGALMRQLFSCGPEP